MKLFNPLMFSFLVVSFSSLQAAPLPDKPHIAVTGSAQLKVKPDMATFSLQVAALEEQAHLAKQSVDQQVTDILTQFEQAGFEEQRLIRSDIQLRPEFQYIDKKRTQVGIRATRQLSYQLQDLDNVNLFLETLVDAGVANIGKINYALKEPLQWQLKVREMAVKDSIAKAEGLAESYQTELGKIFSINYQNSPVQPLMMRAMDAEKAVASYANSEIILSEQIDAVFLLKN